MEFVVPQHRVDHQPVGVDIQSACPRCIVISQVGRTWRVVVGDGRLQDDAAVVAVDRAVGTAGVVAHDAGREDEVLGMPQPVCPLAVAVEIDTTALVGRVVGNHRAQHDAGIVNIDAAALRLRTVVVDERRHDASSVKVDGTAVACRRVLGDDTIGEVSVACHIDSCTTVSIIIGCLRGRRLPSSDCHPVEQCHVVKPVVLALVEQRCEPHHVRRAAVDRPLAVGGIPLARAVIGHSAQLRLVDKLPWQTAIDTLALIFVFLPAGKPTIDTDAIDHAERSGIGGIVLKISRRIVCASSHPHLATHARRRGKVVDGVLHRAVGTRPLLPVVDIAAVGGIDIPDA